jgi:hypothetical protein
VYNRTITADVSIFIEYTARELIIILTDTQRAVVAAYGEWGALYRRYLLDRDKEKYYILLGSGELFERITEFDVKAEHLYEKTVKDLKAENADHLNGRTEEIEKQARELVIKTLILQ